MTSEDLLNSIDLNKLSYADKKKRGRPKKSQQLINPSNPKSRVLDDQSEQDEIILHLPISRYDIQNIKDGDKIIIKHNHIEEEDDDEDAEDNDDIQDDDNYEDEEYYSASELSPSSDSETLGLGIELETKKQQSKSKSKSVVTQKQYETVIRKYRDENDKLKKFLTDITPMYFTEIRMYPNDLKIFDIHGDEFIPKKTRINCWWCTYKFDCLPTCIPDRYHNKSFNVFGCFCSFNCAGAYNISINDNRVLDRYSLLKQMYYMINKNNIIHMSDIEINIAGPKELLEKYGGKMKIEDYRKNSKILGREYHKLIPPFIPMNIIYEETTNSKTTTKSMSINNLINNTAKEGMIIKRTKPVNGTSSEIDKFIG
ncbi:MAG: hypothetical protein Gaeavirus25_3 [Gaeavirus sp.]|uniref:MYM-type domain-containing protein n=1 Tax=Gaeavirus sp. TaxID=2487767 RepID=A0A3G5A1A7_9VIRU|nr:MAG: hypothetical protein Gaeavirus25_3 [Gaeavirus sp.]